MERERVETESRKLFDSYEICILKEKGKKYEAADRELYGLEFKEEEGIALRGIKDGRMVFCYTYGSGEAGIAALIENAGVLIPLTEPDRDNRFAEPATGYPELSLYDEAGLGTDETSKVSMLLEMEKTILDFDKRIVKTRNCELLESEIEVTIVNSNGVEVHGKKTIYTLGALCVAVEAGDEVSWYDWSWSSRLADLKGVDLGREIAGRTVSFLNGQVLATGVYNGFLTPGAACEMLDVIAQSFLAENLYKDKTWLKDKAGQKCFSDLVNITDSGLHGMGSFPFDGEGVPSRVNHLVREGRFEGFLYDLYYGQKLGKPSTGNGMRWGLKEPPKCAPRGFFIEKGSADLKGQLPDGLIITELMGTHTANPVTGDFSLGALGYLCKNGQKKPFKGVIFSGNVFELLRNIKAVGDDLTFYGTYGSPTIYIEGLKISGT